MKTTHGFKKIRIASVKVIHHDIEQFYIKYNKE